MKFGWRAALGVALSALLLVWALRGVHFDVVARVLRDSNWILMVMATVVGTVIFPLRAIRWRTILAPLQERIALGPLWRSTAIGMMVNNVAPARAGEPARAFALSRELPSIPFSAAFASLAVDRLFDAFVVLSLMLVGLLDPATPHGQPIAGQPVSTWLAGGAIFVVAILAVVYAIVFFPERIVWVYARLARRIAPRFEAAGTRALHAFAAGLGVLRQPRRFAVILGWTYTHWLVYAFSWWIAFRGVGVDVPFSAALVLIGIIAIGVAVPSAPGFFGVFEWLAREGLTLYGVDPTRAVSWAISYHLLTFVPITVIGAFYFVRLGMHFRDLRAATQDRP